MQQAPEFGAWRRRARACLAAAVPPEDVHWSDDTQMPLLAGGLPADVAGDDVPAAAGAQQRFHVSSRLLDLLETCACHRDPQRHALMYRVLWRTVHDNGDLLDDAADDDVSSLAHMVKSVNRDCHKMKAFVRFRELAVEGQSPHFVASYEPEHRIVRRVAPFFVRRFGTMVWTIVTPQGAAHWDRHQLRFLDVAASTTLPAADPKEALWLTYYESIFNPARLNLRAMQREMPQKYWARLPEAARIPILVATAAERAGRMVATVSNRERAARGCAPRGRDSAPLASVDKIRIDACRRCDLWERATQGVLGEGPDDAKLMIVGEQPGDDEDLQGKPFVGPAGRLLQRALADAGIPPGACYVTNAVKHFGWEPRGKRRIHKTPAQRHVDACAGWLDAEIARVGPAVIVALGATAINALTGHRLKVGEAREVALAHPAGASVVATYHPSAVLRATDEGERRRLLDALVRDLARAWTQAYVRVSDRASAGAGDA